MDSYSKCTCPDACPYISSCENKVMAHEGLLDPPILEPATADVTQPLFESVLRETMEINVYGTRMTVYKDEIERMIYEPLANLCSYYRYNNAADQSYYVAVSKFYLGTKYNLPTPVTKSNSQNMVITYTLTEVAA